MYVINEFNVKVSDKVRKPEDKTKEINHSLSAIRVTQ